MLLNFFSQQIHDTLAFLILFLLNQLIFFSFFFSAHNQIHTLCSIVIVGFIFIGCKIVPFV